MTASNHGAPPDGQQRARGPGAAEHAGLVARLRFRLRCFWREFQTHLLISLFLVLILLLLLWPRIVYVVQSGEAGVLFRTFGGGTVLTRTYPEGIHFVNPFNTFTVYDTRIQEKQTEVAVLSKNGLTIHVTVTYRYRPVYETLPYLHQKIGPDYVRKMVTPAVVSSIREVVGKYRPEEIYTTHRNTIQDEAYREALEKVRGKHLEFDDVIIRSIRLPELINQAIEAKLREEQRFQEYEFRIKKESQEAKRKLIEAEGIRGYQALVQENITSRLLVWKGIEATRELASSTNAKVVVIGNSGENGLGLPIIMGSDWTKKEELQKALEDDLPDPEPAIDPDAAPDGDEAEDGSDAGSDAGGDGDGDGDGETREAGRLDARPRAGARADRDAAAVDAAPGRDPADTNGSGKGDGQPDRTARDGAAARPSAGGTAAP